MIYIITGRTGAGKTTFSQDFSAQIGAIVFSIDEWNSILFEEDKSEKDGYDWMMERINRSEEMIWKLCMQLDLQSQDVILDLGFSKIDHREKFRKLAKSNEIEHKLVFLDFDKEVRYKRVKNRNVAKGPTYILKVTDEMFTFMEDLYDNPTKEELIDALIIDEHSVLVEGAYDDYFEEISSLHRIELDFCAKLSQGLENTTKLDLLRHYVLDFSKSLVEPHLNIESMVLKPFLKEDSKELEDYFTSQKSILNMLEAIKNNESVSSTYLNQLIQEINAFIRYKERSLFPFILKHANDKELKQVRSILVNNQIPLFEYEEEFWEKS